MENSNSSCDIKTHNSLQAWNWTSHYIVHGLLNSRNTGRIYNRVNWEEQQILKSCMSERNVVPSCLLYSYKSYSFWLKCLKQPEKAITLRSWFSGISSVKGFVEKWRNQFCFAIPFVFPLIAVLSEMWQNSQELNQ